MTDLLSEYRSRLRQATDLIGQLEQALADQRDQAQSAIAVVGIGCRFPPALSSPQALLQALLTGADPVAQAPARAHPGPQAARDPGLRGASFGAFLTDVEGFDADYFSLSPREARTLDPQQRLLLEVTSDALERAGLPATRLQGQRVGVFVGLASGEYLDHCLRRPEHAQDFHAITGNGACFAAGRLSFHFGFEGPCLTLDTACSSSLVAVHLAMQSLRRGECDYALSAGANVVLSPRGSLLLARSQALSPSGRCCTFDAAADGFVRGEGAGAVLLMRAADAMAQRLPIVALLRGSAVNQDGRSTGLTAPNGLAQAKMLRAALADSNLQPADLDFIEAHGTGTSLGDPIEIDALVSVFGAGEHPLHVGAVKSSLGHLEAAAGLAGLIKTIACLQAQTLPANLHFRHLNPRIRLAGSRLRILDQTVPWPSGPRVRRAGVSAFGLSGTNAHVIVEEAPTVPGARPETVPPSTADGPGLLPLSARSDAALRQLCQGYAAALTDDSGPQPPALGSVRLHDLAYSASLGRSHHSHRMAIPFEARTDLIAALQAAAAGQPPVDVAQGVLQGDSAAGPVLVLTGQGSQWAGMAADLLNGNGNGDSDDDAFAQTLRRCEPLVARLAGFSLRAELARPESSTRLHATEVAQPVLCCLHIALAAALADAGIVPAAVLGHSVGELAAAHIAGALTLEQTLALACLRGRILQAVTGQGGMAAVEAPVEQVDSLICAMGLQDRLAIAAENDPSACVLAGDSDALAQALQRLGSEGRRCRRLDVDYAFHSPQLRPLVPTLQAGLASLDLQTSPLQHPLYSTVLGQRIAASELDRNYWLRNVTDRVRFASAVQAALSDGHRLFVELGPQPALTWNLTRCATDRGFAIRAIPTLRRPKHGPPRGRRQLLLALGALYASGCDLRWDALYPGGGQRVPLPTYPFVRVRHFVEAPDTSACGVTAPKAAADAGGFQTYAWGWRATSPIDAAAAFDASGAWQIVAPAQGNAAELAQALASALRAAGGEVTVTDWNSATCRLASAAASPGRRGVLCLAGFDGPGLDEAPDPLSGIQEGTEGLALGQAVLRSEARLWLLLGGATVAQQPAVGVLRGLVRGLGREQPHCAAGVLCLPSGLNREVGVAACLSMLSRPSGEYHLRDGVLCAPTLLPHPLPALSADRAAAHATEHSPIEREASYLVTSGSEGVELTVAEWLASRGATQIVLWGQPASSRPSAGSDPAAAITDPATVTTIQQRLASRGCTLRIVPAVPVASPADALAEEGALSQLVADLAAEGRPLRGVIHAAGQRDDGVFTQQTADRLAAQLWTKAGLALRLHRATQGTDLRFFWLFASLGGLAGAMGQATYAAANAVLHDLAGWRHRQGQPALLLAWTERGADLGAEPLATERALPLLDALLPQSTGAFAVIPDTAWTAWSTSMPAAGPWPDVLADIAPSHTPPAGPPSAEPARAKTQWASLSPEEAERRLLSEVRRAVDHVLGLPEGQSAPIRRGFFDLGLDSLLGLELRNRMQQLLGIPFPSTVIFDHPTIEQLAAHLLTRLRPPETKGSPPTRTPARPDARVDLAALSTQPLMQQLVASVRDLDEAALSAVIQRELEALLTDGAIAESHPIGPSGLFGQIRHE